MKKVGAVLAEARQKTHVTLEEISRITHIRKEYLEAIERNEFEGLPPAVFVKGFLQQYARFVQIDEQTVLALFRRDFKVGSKGKIIPREFIKPVSRKKTIFTPQLSALLSIGVVIVCILGYGGFLWFRFQQPPELEVFTPEQNATVSQNVVVTGKTQSDAVIFVNSNPVSLNPQGLFRAEIYLSGKGVHTITIRAEDRKKRATVIQRTVQLEEQ